MRALFGLHLPALFASDAKARLMPQCAQHWRHHVIAKLKCLLSPSAKRPLPMERYMRFSIQMRI